jgi:phosphoribosylanthranilate isomerase
MTRVKICGITNEADMRAAVAAGADFLGFILYEKSPRAVNPALVTRLMAVLREIDAPRIPLCVGVFVDPAPESVAATLQYCGLQAAQVHKARPDTLRLLANLTHGAVYPAVQAAPDIKFTEWHADQQSGHAVAPWLPDLLLDAYHPDLPGGTGQRADLDFAQQAAEAFPQLMLAGGLTPDNVVETIRAVRPWAVDVASGVEARPGAKDHDKVRAFIAAVRHVDEELTNDLS